MRRYDPQPQASRPVTVGPNRARSARCFYPLQAWRFARRAEMCGDRPKRPGCALAGFLHAVRFTRGVLPARKFGAPLTALACPPHGGMTSPTWLRAFLVRSTRAV